MEEHVNAVVRAARPLGLVALSGLAVLVWFAMAPSRGSGPPDMPSAAQYERLISQALSDNDANEARTDSAPQQQVVNGWVARDLLTIIARANADLLEAAAAAADNRAEGNPGSDQRVPALLALTVLTLAWEGLTREASTVRRPANRPEAMSTLA